MTQHKRTRLSPRQLADHVQSLARTFHVRLDVRIGMRPDLAAAGYVVSTKQRLIVIAPIIDETTYAVALHELGHCLAPSGFLRSEMSVAMQLHQHIADLRDVRLLLEEETAAWAWAKHHALDWTPVMTGVRRMTFVTYRRFARQLGLRA